MLDSLQKYLPEGFGGELLLHLIAIAVTVISAVFVQWAVHVLITRIARKAAAKEPTGPRRDGKPLTDLSDGERLAEKERRAARIETLAGVFRSAAAIFIWVWAILEILSHLGIDAKPLIASAGVVGVALGFGAQSLVKDFLSGIFMLVEDQYGVGDWIDVGDAEGEVENVSLRITTMRDVDGTLWYIRNGLISKVGNSTKGFAVARLEVPVGLSNDVDAAKKAILTACKDGITRDSLKDLVLGEPSVDGVSTVDVDHMNIRVRLKVIPGQQWSVKRQLQGDVLTALKKAGITTPYPNGIGIARGSFGTNEG